MIIKSVDREGHACMHACRGLGALRFVAMSDHVSVTLATHLSVPVSARRNTPAPHTACPASSRANLWP